MASPKSNQQVIQARAWVRGWLARNGARYTFKRQGILIGGKPVRKPVERIWLDAGEAGAKVWGGRDGIEAAFTEWLDEEDERVRGDIADRLRFKADLGDAELRRWVRALKADAEDVDVAVWRHWIWQVKRKLKGLGVEMHLMPILVGKQEGGKSTAIRKLLGPVGDLVDVPSLAAITDDRETFRLNRYSVMFFDEMEGAARADMEKLKNRITAEIVAWRRLGTNEREQGIQRATFVGATDKPVVELIIDPTGMRRFYELRVDDRLDWDAINGVDYVALWQSVDEEGPAPIKAVQSEVRRRQADLVADDPVVQWVEHRCVGNVGLTPGRQLYGDYCTFAKGLGMRPVSEKIWGERLKKHLGPDGWKKSGTMGYRLRLRSEEEMEKIWEELRSQGDGTSTLGRVPSA